MVPFQNFLIMDQKEINLVVIFFAKTWFHIMKVNLCSRSFRVIKFIHEKRLMKLLENWADKYQVLSKYFFDLMNRIMVQSHVNNFINEQFFVWDLTCRKECYQSKPKMHIKLWLISSNYHLQNVNIISC